MSRVRELAPAVFVGGFLALIYFRTLAPGLTWANDGADGGDLITAAVTGGVPHPTGYPTYLLIASAFLRLPLGSLAYRTNLLSAMCMVGAAVAIYLLVSRVAKSVLPGIIAGIAFGTFPLAWSQAIITEVNALHAAFIAAILYWTVTGSGNAATDIGLGLMAGLGLGNHLSTVLALPVLGMKSGLAQQTPAFVDLRAGIRRAGGLLAGLLVYAVIPIRAASHAPVNWGDAQNLSGFLWLVSGRAYWDRLVHFDASYLLTGFAAWCRFLVSQFDVVGLVLIFLTLAFVFQRSRLFLATSWLAAVYSAFAILYFSPDSYVYLLPLLISLSIWMGLGSKWLMDRIPDLHGGWRPVLGTAIAAVFVVRALLAIPAMELSTDRAAEDFGSSSLQSAPVRAILVVSGDEATFSLWYARFARRERTDLAVVSSDLLSQSWYREGLRETFPGLVVPDESFLVDLARANPDRHVCAASLDNPGKLVCMQ